jgi:hydroxymethylbilane synthase
MRLRIGTRRSRLALAQTQEIAVRLGALGVDTDVVPFLTSGDRGAPGQASLYGRKGLFVEEIVGALQRGEVDLAVHSAKDLPSEDPEGVVVGAVPERGDPFDVLVTMGGELRRGAVAGTSSLRRRAQLRKARPDLLVRDLRGNVDTRLAKLERGEVDALVLAAAGLARLGVAPPSVVPFPLDEMVPAPGQGTLAVQVRAGGQATMEVVTQLDHPRSHRAFDAERKLVARMGGGCALPLGAYAEDREDGIRLLAVVIRPDGSDVVWGQAEAPTPASAAAEVAEILLAGGAGQILAEVAGPDRGG